jgi:hypothetical protein
MLIKIVRREKWVLGWILVQKGAINGKTDEICIRSVIPNYII